MWMVLSGWIGCVEEPEATSESSAPPFELPAPPDAFRLTVRSSLVRLEPGEPYDLVVELDPRLPRPLEVALRSDGPGLSAEPVVVMDDREEVVLRVVADVDAASAHRSDGRVEATGEGARATVVVPLVIAGAPYTIDTSFSDGALALQGLNQVQDVLVLPDGSLRLTHSQTRTRDVEPDGVYGNVWETEQVAEVALLARTASGVVRMGSDGGTWWISRFDERSAGAFGGGPVGLLASDEAPEAYVFGDGVWVVDDRYDIQTAYDSSQFRGRIEHAVVFEGELCAAGVEGATVHLLCAGPKGAPVREDATFVAARPSVVHGVARASDGTWVVLLEDESDVWLVSLGETRSELLVGPSDPDGPLLGPFLLAGDRIWLPEQQPDDRFVGLQSWSLDLSDPLVVEVPARSRVSMLRHDAAAGRLVVVTGRQILRVWLPTD